MMIHGAITGDTPYHDDEDTMSVCAWRQDFFSLNFL